MIKLFLDSKYDCELNCFIYSAVMSQKNSSNINQYNIYIFN